MVRFDRQEEFFSNFMEMVIDILAFIFAISVTSANSFEETVAAEFREEALNHQSHLMRFYDFRDTPGLSFEFSSSITKQAGPAPEFASDDLVNAQFVDIVKDALNNDRSQDRQWAIVACFPLFMHEPKFFQLLKSKISYNRSQQLVTVWLELDCNSISAEIRNRMGQIWPAVREKVTEDPFEAKDIVLIDDDCVIATLMPDTIISQDAEDVAIALCYIDWSLLMRTKRRDFLLVPKVDGKRSLTCRLCPGLADLQDRIERLSLWGISLCAWQTTSSGRRKAADFIFKLCTHLLVLNDYFSFGILYTTVLQNQAVRVYLDDISPDAWLSLAQGWKDGHARGDKTNPRLPYLPKVQNDLIAIDTKLKSETGAVRVKQLEILGRYIMSVESFRAFRPPSTAQISSLLRVALFELPGNFLEDCHAQLRLQNR